MCNKEVLDNVQRKEKMQLVEHVLASRNLPLTNSKWKRQVFVVVFDGINDGQSNKRKETNKKNGEVWEVVMGSIGFGDLEGKKKIDRF